jgi:putative DNA primase/helicase
MGDYATTAPTTIFIESRNAQHPTELAHLVGSRMAFAEEINEGQNWAEAKLKQLTGGGRLVARKMRGDFFEFQPTFKLFILANHTPRLHTVDEAIKSRLHLVPFDYEIPVEDRDAKLREKLKAEMPGILRWAINGCLEWQRDGLKPAAAVRAATDEYIRAEDPLADWMDRCCEKDRDAFTSTTDLHRSYMANRGEGAPLSTKAFNAKLRSAGFKWQRTNTAKGFLGIRLKPAPDVNPDGGDIADEF